MTEKDGSEASSNEVGQQIVGQALTAVPKDTKAWPRRALWLLLGGVLGLLAASVFLPAEKKETDLSLTTSETLVTAVRGLSRLETAEMRLQKVVDLKDKQTRMWGLVKTEDAILLIASATVVAGVDLSLVRAEDLEIDEQRRTVRLKLPKPAIFSVSLDNDSTYVYSRTTEVLARRNEQLETKARTTAEALLRQSATDSDILDVAAKNAEGVLTSLIVSLGYDRVEVLYPELPRKH